MAEAKIAFLRDGFNDLSQAFQDISADLDAFIEVYSTNQKRVDERLDRIEKHVGL